VIGGLEFPQIPPLLLPVSQKRQKIKKKLQQAKQKE
jgi:hypothetical protein